MLCCSPKTNRTPTPTNRRGCINRSDVFIRGALQTSHTMMSIRRGCLCTASKGLLRRPAQTTHTPSGRFITWGVELDEGLDGSNAMLFQRKLPSRRSTGDAPHRRRCRMSSLIPRTPTHCGCGHGGSGV
jgi:hypothetical protein